MSKQVMFSWLPTINLQFDISWYRKCQLYELFEGRIFSQLKSSKSIKIVIIHSARLKSTMTPMMIIIRKEEIQRRINKMFDQKLIQHSHLASFSLILVIPNNNNKNKRRHRPTEMKSLLLFKRKYYVSMISILFRIFMISLIQ